MLEKALRSPISYPAWFTELPLASRSRAGEVGALVAVENDWEQEVNKKHERCYQTPKLQNAKSPTLKETRALQKSWNWPLTVILIFRRIKKHFFSLFLNSFLLVWVTQPRCQLSYITGEGEPASVEQLLSSAVPKRVASLLVNMGQSTEKG